ncbi:PREDICTED: G-box-binding factor 3 isoform X2 [Tarenaya hassleriana]|uniref:G-box-binding factor 3 isoform X2 n=1 Tax=Tarenaya hassleriana TaxID=28532 RepID=UPI00053C1D75|nr:PREDICTED: G-box-binding factor 3 isoform X2 [Tarenaya hassleriana]
MGSNSEEPKAAKSDKSSPPPAPATNVHVYPDWNAMQAYYGPRVAAIPPYYNSAVVASGHHHPPPPPYMWGPQPMMSPYGASYAALYSHGGVYAHPGVPMGSLPPGQKVPPSTASGTPLSIDAPTKSTGNTDNGLMKKLKEFDGLAMSIGNGHVENAEGRAEHKRSLSPETEGSFGGSDENTSGADQPKIKRSREGTPSKDERHFSQSSPVSSVSPDRKPVTGAVLSPGASAKSNHCPSQSLAIVPSESWLQNDRELKRERRKQSNRESARRSRLRKQAETEELARKVEALTAENIALRSEINQLSDKSEKLRVENATLVEKLKGSELGTNPERGSSNDEENRVSGVNTENLLSRVNSSGQGDNDPNSNGKLHQLLDTSPRANAVAAG